MSKEKKSIPASTLKSIGDLNPDFDMSVDLPMRSGDPVAVTIKCKAFGKLEWAAIRDKTNDEARARSEKRIEAATEDSEKIKIVNVVKDTMEAEAALVMEFASEWDFAEPITQESLMLLENKCGGAIGAIIGKYEVAIYQGRLGN